ncbi:MAG: guanylate kinase [Bacteroidales bacterium]|nr:guanylate kinase [Bacteroidales bacterium]
MTNDGKLIILSAPSGAGKTSIAKGLLNSDLMLEFSISACSRERRTAEIDGKDYIFLSPDEFKNRKNSGDFLEWEEVYPDHYYGTLKSEVQRIWDNGHHVLFDVDVYGGRKIKQIYGDQVLGIFIQPPSIQELKKRLNSRSSDSPEKIAMRLNKAEEELGFSRYFDRVIINDNLGKAIEETLDVVKSFLNK